MGMWQSRPRDHGPKRYEISGPRPIAPPPAGEPARSVGSDLDVITVTAMQSVAMVFFGMKEVRERQADLIQDKLIGVARGTQGRVAVSLAEVSVLTSSCINALVAVHGACQQLGGHLTLFALSEDLKRMIHVTKLDRTLVVVANAQEAIHSYESRRRGILSALGWGRNDKDAA